MSPAYDHLVDTLKKLPGLGSRSAERMAIHLLAEKPEKIGRIVSALQTAAEQIKRCSICGNLTEEEHCSICINPNRDRSKICIVENISDLIALEKSAAWDGLYHVLNGKLSPLQGIGPEHLNMLSLTERLANESLREILFALPNDIEGEATCHYIQEQLVENSSISVSRIGFGLPSGGEIPYADPTTLRNALESRKGF